MRAVGTAKPYLVSPTENAAKCSFRGHYGSSLDILSAVSMHTYWSGTVRKICSTSRGRPPFLLSLDTERLT